MMSSAARAGPDISVSRSGPRPDTWVSRAAVFHRGVEGGDVHMGGAKPGAGSGEGGAAVVHLGAEGGAVFQREGGVWCDIRDLGSASGVWCLCLRGGGVVRDCGRVPERGGQDWAPGRRDHWRGQQPAPQQRQVRSEDRPPRRVRGRSRGRGEH